MDLDVSRKRSHSASQEPPSKTSKKSSKKSSKKRSKEKSHRSKSKKKRKRRYSSSSSDSSDSSSSSSSSSSSDSSNKRKHKEKKKKKIKQKKTSKGVVLKAKELTTPLKRKSSVTECALADDGPDVGPSINLQSSKMRAPMTKEEYEKQQSTLRWVDDPETGRKRLIRGSGEVVESIVSKERHKEINKQATAGDGQFFQNQSLSKAKSSY